MPTLPDRYFVIGHPVAHSRSPFIHAAFAAASGQAVDYQRHLAPLDGFAAAVHGLAAEGARGLSVTVPFKFEAAALAGTLTPRARLAGAANTLRLDGPEPAQWLADNTDGMGLVRDIEASAGLPLEGRRVLLVGAGGAAAGALGPLLEARPAELVLVNRSEDKADTLVQQHAALAQAHGVRLQAAGLQNPGTGFDVVVNASSSSLQGAALALPAQVLRPGALALDMMYGPAAEPFLAWARAQGALARDGLGMLVEQAAEQFALWRGVRPATAPVLAAVRAEIEAGR